MPAFDGVPPMAGTVSMNTVLNCDAPGVVVWT